MTAHEAPRGLTAPDTERAAGPADPPQHTPEERTEAPPPRTPAAAPQDPEPAKPTSQPPHAAAPATRSGSPTTVLPDSRLRRPAPPRSTSSRTGDRVVPARTTGAVGRARKVRLALKRVDPWSVFLFSLLASVFAGLAVVVAVAALYFLLGSIGVVDSVNELVGEVTGEVAPLITASRFLGGAAVLAAVNVVLLTLLATLSALLYNLCASFTGGIELTLGERDG